MNSSSDEKTEKVDNELEYHLQCIQTFVAEAEEDDENLDLKNYNLYEITSSLFESTNLENAMSSNDENQLPPATSSSSYVDTLIDQAMSSNKTMGNPFQDLEDYLADVVDPTLEERRSKHDDMKLYLRAAGESQDSTLDTPTNYSSGLDTPIGPQRIVSQPSCVDTLTALEFPISEVSQPETDATDLVLAENPDTSPLHRPSMLEIEPNDPLEATNTGSITYVSPFSLETWGREGEEVSRRRESIGARRQIRSVTSLFLDSSLKITQIPEFDGADETSDAGESSEIGNYQDSGFHSLDSSSTRHKNSSVSSLSNAVNESASIPLEPAEVAACDISARDIESSVIATRDPAAREIIATRDSAHDMLTRDGPVKSKGVGTPDQVLTTLDRPRAQSLVGTPLRQAWVQVSCYERDTQTGNFLIDKHRVQIDGQFLHPELNNSPELYRISLAGLVNDARPAKTEKMLPDIGPGIVIQRNARSGNVTLTKLTDRDVYMLNKNFLLLKGDEKCKGKHLKLEKNFSYTIFDKQQFVEDVKSNVIDLSQIHTIGQVAIAFLKINNNSTRGVPCWIKIQCLEAMNLLKNILSGSAPEDREWLRKQPADNIPPRRASSSRISFSKSLSKSSLKDKTGSSSDSSSTPIPRTRSEHVRSSRRHGESPSNSSRGSVVSNHLQPLSLNYSCDIMSAADEPPPRRDSVLLKNSGGASITGACVSLPLRRDEPS